MNILADAPEPRAPFGSRNVIATPVSTRTSGAASTQHQALNDWLARACGNCDSIALHVTQRSKQEVQDVQSVTACIAELERREHCETERTNVHEEPAAALFGVQPPSVQNVFAQVRVPATTSIDGRKIMIRRTATARSEYP